MKPRPKLAKYNVVSTGDTGVIVANDRFYRELESSDDYDLLKTLFDIAYEDACKKKIKFMWVKLPKEILYEIKETLDMYA
jgi:hypothetical protein